MNYFVHGIQAVILAQGALFFASKWQVSEADVFRVLGAVGIGKVIVMLFSGVLADLFGRKLFIVLGMLGYLGFFGGLILTTDVHVAYALAVLAGGATSLLDGATYPALSDMYGQKASLATLILKGFIGVASASVPFLVRFLQDGHASLNWLLFGTLMLIGMNLCVLLPLRFPQMVQRAASEERRATDDGIMSRRYDNPHFVFEGVLLLCFAFFCLGTFYLWQQSSMQVALHVLGMGDIAARGVPVIFSLSTILSVVLTSITMQKGVQDIAILVYYTGISTLALFAFYLFPSVPLMYIVSFVVGFFMAGGILQIGNALLSQFFPLHKGLNTSLYNVSFALATYVVPLIIHFFLVEQHLEALLLVAVIFSSLSFIVVLVLSFCYQRVFGLNAYVLKQK